MTDLLQAIGEIQALERRNSELTAKNEALNGKLTAAILGNQTEVDRLTARIAELEKERDDERSKRALVATTAASAIENLRKGRDEALSERDLALEDVTELRQQLAEARKDSARIEKERDTLLAIQEEAIDTLDGNLAPIDWKRGGPELLRKLAEHLEAMADKVKLRRLLVEAQKDGRRIERLQSMVGDSGWLPGIWVSKGETVRTAIDAIQP